ncbi:MAG TPA: IclR family transcriptional regulator [Anaerolineae bacterium]
MSSATRFVSRDELTPPTVKTSVPAVEQASRVLLCLAESPRSKMRLTDICDHLGISKSKGHAILNTLKQFELIDKDPQTKTYSLGPALIFLSQRVLDNLSYPEVVAPFLEDLVKETNGTVAFGLIDGSYLYIIAKREGNQNIGFRLPLGHRFHITLGAHGIAIAAFMGKADRETLLAKKNLHFYGDSSRMDLRRLEEDMAKCKSAGFAQDIGQVTPGVTVLSAPVFTIRERMVGCVILIGTFESSKVQDYGTKVALASRQISRKFGAQVNAIYPM